MGAERPLRPLRFNLAEFGAGFADVGIWPPVAIALIALNGLGATTVFVGSGVMYLVSGLYFRVPVAVQPLKAMAALALASGAGPELLGTAGILMGLCLLLLSFPGPLALVRRMFPLSVVRGVQLGVGLLLLEKAASLITHGASGAMTVTGLVITFLLWSVARRWSVLLPVLLVLASGFAWWLAGTPSMAWPTGPAPPTPPVPDLSLAALAFASLVLPQLPLTLGNAVMATHRTARDHFGACARRVTPQALCRSLGVGNILIGSLCGMPVCHGAGGMTAHVRYGARGGGATVMFGALLVVVGLLFGAAVAPVAALVPAPVLGAFLAPAGWMHAWMIRDLKGNAADGVVAVSAGVTALVFHSILWGIVAGWAAWWSTRGVLSVRVPD